MYVQVVHSISDPERWKQAFDEAPEIPAEFNLHTSVTSAAGDTAYCLWEAESAQSLRGFLDEATSGFASNAYDEIDSSAAGTILPSGGS